MYALQTCRQRERLTGGTVEVGERHACWHHPEANCGTPFFAVFLWTRDLPGLCFGSSLAFGALVRSQSCPWSRHAKVGLRDDGNIGLGPCHYLLLSRTETIRNPPGMNSMVISKYEMELTAWNKGEMMGTEVVRQGLMAVCIVDVITPCKYVDAAWPIKESQCFSFLPGVCSSFWYSDP